jgi:hypothetical protein
MRNKDESFQSWCSDWFYSTLYEFTLRIACFVVTASFRRKLFAKRLQDLILNWLNYRVELSVSKCSLFRVTLKTVSRKYTLGLLWKVLKEGHIICCLFVLHTTLSTAVYRVIIIAEIHIALTVLPVLPVFVHLNNDDVGRYSKVQCHLAPLI